MRVAQNCLQASTVVRFVESRMIVAGLSLQVMLIEKLDSFAVV